MKDILVNICIDSALELFDQIEGIQFWIKDETGAFVKVNRGFLENYALHNENQVIGKTDFDFSPPYIAEQFQQDDMQVLKGKSIVNRVELVYSANNLPKWYLTNKRPMRDLQGKIIGTMGITKTLSDNENKEIPIFDLNKVVDFIHKNIQRKIAVSELAGIMNCSVTTVERKFQQLFHCNPTRFIQRIRLEYACKALIKNEVQISEISFDLGFSDVSHFIREFRKYMRITPHQYRKQFFNKVV